MPAISVSCDRWLGFGEHYVVRIDGHEVGRLGRTSKQVSSDVSAGKHSVLVDFAGRTTAAEHVDVAGDDSVSFALVFGSVIAGIALATVKPLRQKITEPIGRAGETSTMALVRLD